MYRHPRFVRVGDAAYGERRDEKRSVVARTSRGRRVPSAIIGTARAVSSRAARVVARVDHVCVCAGLMIGRDREPFVRRCRETEIARRARRRARARVDREKNVKKAVGGPLVAQWVA